MTGKNIILCSDGTGNRGGKGHGTNVWRLYNGVHLRISNPRQITYYDDGVGTDDNKYLRAFGGAFGWGFTRNVKQAYRFLVRNWEQGDSIYMFGFSRGAYTVRALAAFVAHCGMIKNGREESETGLEEKIRRLVDAYHREKVDDNYEDVELTRPVPIESVGVWDTVSAIGLPFDMLLKTFIYRFFHFKFRDHELRDAVKSGMQALAIDDERRTFHPTLWKEDRAGIEQVWFAGVHSNVGGGYPKQEMSHVALEWMISKCKWDGIKGIVFEPEFEDEVRRNANVHGRLYDSRAGAAAYYRFAPRDIDLLCRENDIKTVKIHQSVFERIQSATDGYNPGSIPVDHPVEVVGDPGSKATEYQIRAEETRSKRKEIVARAVPWIHRRKALHLLFVLMTMLTAAAFAQFFILRPDASEALKACNCVVGLGGWWFYLVPSIVGLLILVTLFCLKRPGRKILCFSALVLVAAFTFTDVGLPHPVWDFGTRISGLLGFLLPDIVAAALEYFIDNYPVQAVAVILAYFILWDLNSRFRRRSDEIYEQACRTLRI